MLTGFPCFLPSSASASPQVTVPGSQGLPHPQGLEGQGQDLPLAGSFPGPSLPGLSSALPCFPLASCQEPQPLPELENQAPRLEGRSQTRPDSGYRTETCPTAGAPEAEDRATPHCTSLGKSLSTLASAALQAQGGHPAHAGSLAGGLNRKLLGSEVLLRTSRTQDEPMGDSPPPAGGRLPARC